MEAGRKEDSWVDVNEAALARGGRTLMRARAGRAQILEVAFGGLEGKTLQLRTAPPRRPDSS